MCFVSGQSSKARVLINDVYEKFGESCLDMLRTRQTDKEEIFGELDIAREKQTYETKVFVAMYREASITLSGSHGHNSYLNWYNHYRHYNLANTPLEVTPVHIPSKLFWFSRMGADVVPQVKPTSEDQKVQDCVVYIDQPSQKATKNLLYICQRICQVQPISDLFVNKVSGRHLADENTFIMSRDAQTVWIHKCNFTSNFWQCFLSSLCGCKNL